MTYAIMRVYLKYFIYSDKVFNEKYWYKEMCDTYTFPSHNSAQYYKFMVKYLIK